MEAIVLPIYNTEGKEVDSLKLDMAVFNGRINTDAIYQVINSYRANQRKGLASTKTRGEVSGGGRKPWRQKGTGRARVGSTRSPLWRHGGVVFGPHPRDFSYSVPDKLKSLALKSALNAKVKEKGIIVLDSLFIPNPKTKEAIRVLSNLKIEPRKKQKVLLLMDSKNDGLIRGFRNINFLNINLATNTNTYEILTHQKLVITRDGLNQLIGRLKK